VDTFTSPDTVERNRQHRTEQLAQRLSAAWSATQPCAQPPAGWLTCAAAVLAAAPAALGRDAGQLDLADTSARAGWPAIAEQLRHVRAETREQARAAISRSAQLAQLQAQIRERAINQLVDSPELEGPLRDALADWGLSPIDDEDDDEAEDEEDDDEDDDEDEADDIS
jgi:hypothetical protein